MLRLATSDSFNGKPQATGIRVAIVASGLPLNEEGVTNDKRSLADNYVALS